MTTITVFSDLHEKQIPPTLLAVAEESDRVFFLGDGAARLGELALHKGFAAVRGNCDSLPLPEETVTEAENVKILLTHGHAYGVKSGLLALSYRARELGCPLVFYGHTHFADVTECDGVTLVNPGALSRPLSGTPTYAYAVVNKGKFVVKTVPCLY